MFTFIYFFISVIYLLESLKKSNKHSANVMILYK